MLVLRYISFKDRTTVFEHIVLPWCGVDKVPSSTNDSCPLSERDFLVYGSFVMLASVGESRSKVNFNDSEIK